MNVKLPLIGVLSEDIKQYLKSTLQQLHFQHKVVRPLQVQVQSIKVWKKNLSMTPGYQREKIWQPYHLLAIIREI